MSSSSVGALVDEIARLRRPLLVALDVDGTISPIVRNPDLAAIPEPTLRTLERLASIPRIFVALVTGRALDSLRRMERLEGIWRGVEHGGVVLAPGERVTDRSLSRSKREALERFGEWAENAASDAFIEVKPQAVAVHVRAIAETDPERADRLLAAADALAESLGLHVRRGKALREAEAVHHDKGSAVAELLERTGATSVFFAGDDITDFPAIELAAARGIGAFVRSNERRETPSEHAVVLDGVDALSRVLHELVTRLAD